MLYNTPWRPSKLRQGQADGARAPALPRPEFVLVRVDRHPLQDFRVGVGAEAEVLRPHDSVDVVLQPAHLKEATTAANLARLELRQHVGDPLVGEDGDVVYFGDLLAIVLPNASDAREPFDARRPIGDDGREDLRADVRTLAGGACQQVNTSPSHLPTTDPQPAHVAPVARKGVNTLPGLLVVVVAFLQPQSTGSSFQDSWNVRLDSSQGRRGGRWSLEHNRPINHSSLDRCPFDPNGCVPNV